MEEKPFAMMLAALFLAAPVVAGETSKPAATGKHAVESRGVTADKPAAAAASQTRHSGRVVRVDPGEQTLTFEEMGPWMPHQSVLTKRTIRLAPGADVTVVSRTTGMDPYGWLGGFVESAAGLSDLRPGDWVTVLVERGPRPTAVSIEAVRPGSG